MKATDSGRVIPTIDQRAASTRKRRLVGPALLAIAAAAGASPALGVVKEWDAASGMWNVSGNWTPNGAPTGLDSVLIGNTAAALNATVTLNASPTVASLSMTDGMTLDTNLFSMFVGTTTSLSGANTVGSTTFATTLRVENGAGTHDFRTDNLNVTNSARVNLVGGGVLRVDGFFLLDGSSRLTGDGVINLTGSDASVFQLDGELAAGFNGITINRQGTGRIDLDGGVGGDRTISVTATNGTGTAFASLTVNGDQLLDAFDDSFDVGSNNQLNMNLSNGWTLGGSGKVRFVKNPSFPGAAQVNGSTVTFNGDIEFSGAAHGMINAAAIVNSTASVSMPAISLLDFNGDTTINGGSFTLGQFARLSFDGPTQVNGGTFATFNNNPPDGDIAFNGPTQYSGSVTFNGNARQEGNVTVNAPATINANLFDMDGMGFANFYTLSAPLTINADALEPTGANDVEAAISVGPAAHLNVNLPPGQSWRASGTVSLQGPGAGLFNTALLGSPIELAGQTHVNANNASTARLDFAGGGTTTINANSTLRLVGGSLADPNTISGGLITGSGTLQASGARALVGHGTIASNIDFINGAELRAKGGVLTVNGTMINQMGAIGTADSTGTLNFATSFSILSTHKLDLKGGHVIGSAIANQGLITGHGTIATEQLANSDTISAVGGELILNPNGTLDLDGVLGGVPVVNAVAGDINVAKSISDAFDGIANVGGGRTMRFANGWNLGAGGTINIGGSLVQPATITSDSAQIVLGRVNVNFGAHFDAPTGFLGGSSVSLPNASDQLSLLKGATVTTGSIFSGNGSLRNAPASALLVTPGASIQVHLQNEGTLRTSGDNQVGTIFLKSMTEMPSATTKIEIGGPNAGAQFDRIELTGGAAVDGTLVLSTLNGYVPANLVQHEIIQADNGISGVFQSITGMQITPTKFWAVTYDADSVFATAARPGDANLDGSVNLSDFNILAGHFGQIGSSWQTADFTGDGVVNLTDFNLLAGNFGAGGAAPGVSADEWAALASSIPEPHVGLPTALAGFLAGRRRRRAPRSVKRVR